MAVQIFNRACLRGLFAVVLTLALGLSGEANAQSSSFNGTQATTFTLTSGVNTSTFTFGPNSYRADRGWYPRGHRRYLDQLERHQLRPDHRRP